MFLKSYNILYTIFKYFQDLAIWLDIERKKLYDNIIKKYLKFIGGYLGNENF